MGLLNKARLIAIAVSSITFAVIVFFGAYSTHTANNGLIHQQTSVLKGLSRNQVTALERRLTSAITSTQILAYEVEHHSGTNNWFEEYAHNLISTLGEIENLQLSPDGIIEKVYPLKGHESAIGLDIFSKLELKEAAMSAIIEHKPIIIGPIHLVQGGIAIITRTPIYLNRGSQYELFWGFSSAVLALDSLLESTQLKQLESEGYQYQLLRRHAETNEEVIVSESSAPLSDFQIHTELTMTAGTWKLVMSKEIASLLKKGTITGYTISLTIALLVSIALYNLLMQPRILRQQVKEKTAELQKLVYLDPLTGLPNRRYMHEKLPEILEKNQKNNIRSAFIYFDLDNFKRINDTIGHDIGDQVLAVVAKRLNALKNKADEVIRLGGDEFGVLINHVDKQEDVINFATQILQDINEPLMINNTEHNLSTSLGIAMTSEHCRDIVTIMQNADMALYKAKQSGKNCYAFYSEEMKQNTFKQIQDEYDLAHAIKENEFELYYQPQFDLHTNKILAAEALIRWNHPEKGLIFPDKFIPLAENTGKIVELGYWILESSIAYIAKRKREGLPDILLHINLSSKQLADPQLVHSVQSLIAKYDIPVKSLGFEITESLILEDLELAKSVLQTFKEMGICIAIDDFGTGYSSLAQLKNLPVALLKIDRSFVMDLEHDMDDRKIIEAIIAMAHKLNIKVLAEGIEKKEQWEALASFHCDFGQGYYVSKAVKAEEFEKISIFLKDHNAS